MTNTKGNDSIKKVRELRRVLTEDAKRNYVNQGMTEEEITEHAKEDAMKFITAMVADETDYFDKHLM